MKRRRYVGGCVLLFLLPHRPSSREKPSRIRWTLAHTVFLLDPLAKTPMAATKRGGAVGHHKERTPTRFRYVSRPHVATSGYAASHQAKSLTRPRSSTTPEREVGTGARTGRVGLSTPMMVVMRGTEKMMMTTTTTTTTSMKIVPLRVQHLGLRTRRRWSVGFANAHTSHASIRLTDT